ncbi:MAG: DNA polymerase Y family protein [Proteobacteria bacterium]|nr:DNA polymerase Y family protein [Pseudomonadota bacterium]
MANSGAGQWSGVVTKEHSTRRRILALWLPRLPAERWRRLNPPGAAPAKPLVFSQRSANARIVYALDRDAARLGLRAGMPLASARAIVGEIEIVEADPAADRRKLVEIADWCDRFSPFVTLDPPHGLVLDITGVSHLFADASGNGEEKLLAALCNALRKGGFTACAAIAGTAVAARALARFAPGTVAAPGDEAATLAPLPAAALDLDVKDTTALRRAGLKTVGQVAERSRAELTARFGKEMVFKLDRALGKGEKPISPRRILPAFSAERRFAEPVVSEDMIAETLHGLAGSLAAIMEERGKGARRLEASFFRSDGVVRRIAVETGRPLREPGTIAKLFRTRLDALADPLDPGFGFDMVRLDAVHSERLVPESVGLEARPDDDKEIAFLIDRLAARFGSHRMLSFLAQDTHIPEAAGVAVPAQHAPDPTVEWERREPGEPPRRPLRLFAKPEPIEAVAQVPDGPPVTFQWRRLRHRVRKAEGPERIAMEWWQGEDHKPTRDYFRVEDETGRRFWLFREGLYHHETMMPKWFVHGLFA